ncbi:PfkB family carbohydrate kinase [uncultured Pseudokineococcus sp.]|uniref:PfkB family carbohydrate kinase n=1 Tax=uncultured Pseudokineococcus sp. TaxID=1642928 RepID=UPI00262970A3|nr:PfkB family carbohydrate kinase [uncultured Pseudokineococcus sp.]
MSSAHDVVVLGEVLVEVSTALPAAAGVAAVLSFSGDALNAAAAAAAAGARTGLVARVPDDELGDALVDRVAALGVGTDLLRRVPGQHGVYLQHSDPAGERQFSYARAGSAGSTLDAEDLDDDVVAAAGVVLASGITAAVSASALAAVRRAARSARRFVFDPNHRPRLTSAAAARAVLAELAPRAALVTPSWPGETGLLLDADDPRAAAAAVRALGAAAAAVTCGSRGVLVSGDGPDTWVPAVPAPALVDQTGAGDVLAGTTAARLAQGDDLVQAVRTGTAAASLALGGRGGTGLVASAADVRAHLATAGRPPVVLDPTEDPWTA